MSTRWQLEQEHTQIVYDFQQLEGETVEEAWIRMKDILEYYYCHMLNKHLIIQTFYYGLNNNSRDILDYASVRNFLSNTTDESIQILEDKVFLILERSTEDYQEDYPQSNPDPWYTPSNHYQEDSWYENLNSPPNPKQSQPTPNEETTLSSLAKMLEAFITSQQTTNERISTEFDNIIFNMEQSQRNQQVSLNNLDKTLDRLINKLVSEPVDDDGDEENEMELKATGTTHYDYLVPEPVEDDFTDEDSEDEEMEDEKVEPISEPVIKDPKDDEELDKQLQELLNIESGEAEENNEHITAEEFDEILEMNIVEFDETAT